jgi:DNA-binding NarL/FixJ family response regulator
MGKQVDILISNKTIKLWMEMNKLTLNQFVQTKSYTNFKTLYSFLITKEENELNNKCIFLDVEDELHLDYAWRLKTLSSGINLLAIGLPKDIEFVKQLFKNGYISYIDVTSNEIDVVKAIEKAQSKKYYLPESKVEEIIFSMVQEEKETQPSSFLDKDKLKTLLLTKKDKEVIEYIIKGYTYKSIAEILNLTTFAVNQRTKSVYKKCGVRSRNELSYLLLK